MKRTMIPVSPFYLALGQKIRARRRAIDMTQAELAQASGLSEGMISQVEIGFKRLRLEPLHKLAIALGVDLGPLFPTQADRGHP